MLNRERLVRLVKPSLALIIGVVGTFFLFSGWVLAEKTVRATASYSGTAELEVVKRDLAKLDAYATAGKYGDAGVLFGQDIKARDVYRLYLNRASQMSDELMSVRKTMLQQANTITLQQLGALSQRLTLNNLYFRRGFNHGEQQFQTYKLIEKAVTNLEDAIKYWRISNRYRHIYRGGAMDRVADDEILKTKLETAMNAIDELKSIIEARETLTRDLTED